ncbi:hypothetical protein [Rhodovulum sp. MB263]|uniref:hypothetical protein n=1 Tax=Rhodovulum sp. (strain MB263) TaxID=308754 RepID=UPI0009B74673|nr:hypothetical protein [Rhodovulum sp. MB263]ARC88640.1 hypothetical protein B5V46_08425 [Rhodovulum sp. MB263]
MATRTLFEIDTALASPSASDLPSRRILVDGDRLDMTVEELVAETIGALVDRPMTAIRTPC